MVLDDRLVAMPSASVTQLSPETLQHWGLLGSPFSCQPPLEQMVHPNEFYFRTAAHASAWSWLQNLLRLPTALAVVGVSESVGATTWVRQLQSTSGIGETAVQIAASRWQNQSLVQLTAQLDQVACPTKTSFNVRTLWLIHAADESGSTGGMTPSRSSILWGWWSARAKSLHNLNVVLVVRKREQHALSSTIGAHVASHSLSRSSSHEMRRCVNAALHHAGAVRPIFTVSAVSHLAERCRGSIKRLASLVHTSLIHGHAAGARQITQSDLTRILPTICNEEGRTERSRAA